MRDFLDSVLEVIGQASLTDDEFDLDVIQSLVEPPSYTQDTFLALRTVLEARESVSDALKRLRQLFLAHGVDVSPRTNHIPVSNIFLGAGL